MSDRAYFEKAVQLIDQARESIAISLYEFDINTNNPRHPGSQLAQALINANRRNVSVFIVLNRNYDFSNLGEESVFTRNDEAYSFLKNAGIRQVYFADPGRRVHDKVIVIDKEWVIEGSHNWSYSALRVNRESATLIHSRPYAGLKQARIEGLKHLEDQEAEALSKAPIKLDNAFLKDPRYLKRFVNSQDFRSMALYLWLVYESVRQNSKEFEIDLAELARRVKLPADWSRSKTRRQIIKALNKKLVKRYGLIEMKIPFGDNAQIRLLPISSNEKGFISISMEFFEDGMIRNLSHAGLTAYLTALYLSETSPIRPWWTAPQTGWAGLFGISLDVVQEGTHELRRLNLIEVTYFGQDRKPFFKNRPTSQYRLNPIFSEKDEIKKWQALRKQAGIQAFSAARRYARILDDPRDPVLTGKLLELMRNYPEPWIQEAMRRMRDLQYDNPRKNVDYVEGILEGFALTSDPASL